ncbi:MAG: hypothetical protein WA885_11830 [Phormidesmis sp.]
MTSQKDQIQSLITDIERVLSSQGSRKPWIRSSEIEPQRQALLKAQDYLRSLQETFDAPGGWGPVDPNTGQIATQGHSQGQRAGQKAGNQPSSSIFAPSDQPSGLSAGEAETVLQALLTEMRFLKSSALEPLRLDMDRLREERDQLAQEVEALAAQRGGIANKTTGAEQDSEGISDRQMNQFLQALMARLQESLSVQVGQTLSQLERDHSNAIAQLSANQSAEALQLRSSGELDELRQLQSRSDQLLVNIDATLQRMFETLQRNIDSYQLSLNEGIENMHSLGRQGEVIVRSLVDHLTQQLGQTPPPEPAFFPPRPTSLAGSEAAINEADEADATANATESPIETVSSLDEILSDVSDRAAADVLDSDDANLTNADAAAVNADTADNALQPEDCIREDGTIDLDLLKLDIDRDEDDANLTLDDLTVDAATADAKVAADEAEDTEIEAKVTPTADAVYLADLTLDDLTIDPATDPAFAPDSPEDIPSQIVGQITQSDEQAVEPATADDGLAETLPISETFELRSPDSQLPGFQSGEDADLAAILPDLGGPIDPTADASVAEWASDDPDEMPTEGMFTIETPTEETSAETLIEEPLAESFEPFAGPLGAQPVAEETFIERGLAEAPGKSSVETVETIESSLVPDIPDADDELTPDLPPLNEVDDRVSDALLTALDTANREAEQIAIETNDSELDTLASDLEEATVFEADAPVPETLSASAPTLESALIPDQPADEPSDMATVEAELVVEQEFTERGLDSDGATEPPSEEQVDGQQVDGQQVDGQQVEQSNEPQPLAASFSTADPFEESLLELESEIGASIDSELENDPANLPVQSEEPTLSAASFDDDLDFYTDTVFDDSVEMMAAEETTGTFAESDAAVEAVPIIAPPVVAPPLPDAAASSASLVPEPLVSDPLVSDPLVPESPRLEADEPDRLSRQPELEDGEDDPTDGEPAEWFLGIDIGTTGLSAVLINQLGEQVYPLCWDVAGDDQANRFRLPAVARVLEQGERLGTVGPVALQQGDKLLRTIKPLMKIGIPHGTSGDPLIQWSDQVTMPLLTVQRALSELLQTLSADRTSCRAVGLTSYGLRQILSDLKGVVVGYPNNWPDTYSFNVREALLSSEIVSRPEQVFFVEEAIAALLSALPDPQKADESAEEQSEQQPGLYNCHWSGPAVVLSAGATLTESAIVNLPTELDQITHSDFALRSFTYAGDAIDQDIICQLLHLPLKEKLAADGKAITDAIGGWQSLGLDNVALPRVGEAERIKRHRLRQLLNASALGREVVAAARQVKAILQEDAQMKIVLGDQEWVLKRKDLETKIFVPYIQRINRQINLLLNHQGLSTQAVKQVVCTGGSASLSVIARWLRQKFPNATIIQDTYSGEYSNSCSRVAYGLANLCHYPRVLDANRHQYNDYFLLLELLRVLPDQPLPAGGIMHLLEQRGIDTQACRSHILALIEGHLPPGLVPTEGDRPMISAQSPDTHKYTQLAELPLFKKQGGQIYIADAEQGDRLRTHLDSLLATKAQALKDPLTVQLDVEAI